MQSYCYFSSHQQEEKKIWQKKTGENTGRETVEIKSLGPIHTALWEDKKNSGDRKATQPMWAPSKEDLIGMTLTNTGKELLKSHHVSLLVTPPICRCLWLQTFPAHAESAGPACSHRSLNDSVLWKCYRKLRAWELRSCCLRKPPETTAWKAGGFPGCEMENI